MLFCWFVRLAIEDIVWNYSVFNKSRDRLLERDANTELFNAAVEMANRRGLLPSEHFSMDYTFIQARASHQSVRCNDGSDDGRPPGDWRGKPRTNDTHEFAINPEWRPDRKSNAAPASPGYHGYVLTDNRHGMVLGVQASALDSTADCNVAAQLVAGVAAPGKRVTVGAYKPYVTKGSVAACTETNFKPHVAQNLMRSCGSAIYERIACHPGYEVISQSKRKRIEQCFGWGKLIGPIRYVIVRGVYKVDRLRNLTAAAYNLAQLRTLAQLRP